LFKLFSSYHLTLQFVKGELPVTSHACSGKVMFSFFKFTLFIQVPCIYFSCCDCDEASRLAIARSCYNIWRCFQFIFFCQKTGNLRFVLTKLFLFFNVLSIDKCLEKLLIDSACLPYFGVLAKDPINSRV